MIWVIFLFFAGSLSADENEDLSLLMQSWANANYKLEGEEKDKEFQNLVASAESAVNKYPDDARIWIWSGIIKSTYAGFVGGIKPLGLVKEARNDLEKAISIDDEAMSGSAYASLGTLYFSVPGWPISYGDDDMAEELLQKALSLNSQSIDNNYFYGLFLIKQKRYSEAREYLLRAKSAAPRLDRPIADSGRQMEIDAALKDLE